MQNRPTLLGRAVEGVGRLEAGSRHRVTQHRSAVAAAPPPRVLDQALRPARRGPPASQRADQGPRHTNGRGESPVGCPQNPRRAPEARHRRGRAHRLPPAPKRRTPPSQSWRTFLTNHVRDLVSIDFFTVPTAGLRVLFVLVVLAHDRRRVLHFNVTEHPTAAWTAQQIVDAFPDDSAPSYLLRDRDKIYGHSFRQRVRGMGIDEILTAPHSPWQNPSAERLIGSIRRECLNHVLVLGERHLRRTLARCRVEGWRGTPCARLQPPPDRTAQTVFPYAALLPASRQGL